MDPLVPTPTRAARLLAVGTALPELTVDAAEALERYGSIATEDPGLLRRLSAMFRRSGVERRHVVLPEARDARGEPLLRAPLHAGDRGPTTAQRMEAYAAHAAPLAILAARRALEAAGVAGQEITQLVTVSCTGFEAPGVDLALVRALGLPPTVRRTHLGFMGCHGALNGLHAASGGLAAAGGGRALVCAVELCSLHASWGWDPERLVPSVLFGDGAAAAVLAPGAEAAGAAGAAGAGGNDPRGDRAPADGGGREGARLGWRLAAHGSVVLPGSEDDMGWRVGDHGFEMRLSARVPALIEEHLAPWLAAWLDGEGLAVGAVRAWAVHPGGPRILDATERGLGLPAGALDVSRAALAEHGNLSSPTVLFVLARLALSGAQPPCVALGFGPGLSAEAALLLPG